MAASVEDILDEILMSDNDSKTEQLVESAGLQRVADVEEKLEVIVKKSSPKNLSADCRSTVGRQLTDRLPTVYRQLTNRLPTG